jgi:hypothetical protein
MEEQNSVSEYEIRLYAVASESEILFNLLEFRYFYWLVEPKFEVQKLPFF